MQGSLAIIYLGLGDDDKFFECLDRAADEGDDLTTMLRMPTFKRVRQDPRFSSFLKRMNLKP